jgi:hypothetical protein
MNEAIGVPFFYGVCLMTTVGIYCVVAWQMDWTKAPRTAPIWKVITTSYEVLEAELADVDAIEVKLQPPQTQKPSNRSLRSSNPSLQCDSDSRQGTVTGGLNEREPKTRYRQLDEGQEGSVLTAYFPYVPPQCLGGDDACCAALENPAIEAASSPVPLGTNDAATDDEADQCPDHAKSVSPGPDV